MNLNSEILNQFSYGPTIPKIQLTTTDKNFRESLLNSQQNWRANTVDREKIYKMCLDDSYIKSFFHKEPENHVKTYFKYLIQDDQLFEPAIVDTHQDNDIFLIVDKDKLT
jgi:hypothetical protein